ncbi:MAG: PIN domain-containing protein [Terriglobales bacterium]|jgi:predicted nucleic acid-binding protein
MSGADFLDTNVVVYAYDENHPQERQIARQLIERGVAGKTVVSAQVLAEFAATMLHEVSPAATEAAVITALDALSNLRVVTPDAELVRRAVEARAAYGIHFYDGMIVAAAERAGCERILSEDFNAGQEYFGVTVANPFR